MYFLSKYEDLKEQGIDSASICEAALNDGLGRLRVITVLRSLFDYSLEEANDMFDRIESRQYTN